MALDTPRRGKNTDRDGSDDVGSGATAPAHGRIAGDAVPPPPGGMRAVTVLSHIACSVPLRIDPTAATVTAHVLLFWERGKLVGLTFPTPRKSKCGNVSDGT